MEAAGYIAGFDLLYHTQLIYYTTSTSPPFSSHSSFYLSNSASRIITASAPHPSQNLPPSLSFPTPILPPHRLHLLPNRHATTSLTTIRATNPTAASHDTSIPSIAVSGAMTRLVWPMRQRTGTLKPRTHSDIAVSSWWSFDGLVGLRRVGRCKRRRRRGMRMAIRARLVVDGAGDEGVC